VKGLEYENVVLYRFISDHRAEFSEIVDRLSRRSGRGHQLNPKLAVRRRQGDEETWTPACAARNLPLINEFSRLNDWGWPDTIPKVINRFLLQAGLPGWRVPIAERAAARAQARARRTPASSF
jgi:hypothetical protein